MTCDAFVSMMSDEMFWKESAGTSLKQYNFVVQRMNIIAGNIRVRGGRSTTVEAVDVDVPGRGSEIGICVRRDFSCRRDTNPRKNQFELGH